MRKTVLRQAAQVLPDESIGYEKDEDAVLRVLS